MSKKQLIDGYNPNLALSGAQSPLAPIETWPNQYHGYEIKIDVPELTSLRYLSKRLCLELKSFKYYILGYRNMGIFYKIAVNRILDDIVRYPRRAFPPV